MVPVVNDNRAGAGRTTAGLEEEVRPGRRFVNDDPFFRIAIDIQHATGIRLTKRHRVLRKVEPDEKSLAPRHREISCHPQR
jgi:hypothetical protein